MGTGGGGDLRSSLYCRSSSYMGDRSRFGARRSNPLSTQEKAQIYTKYNSAMSTGHECKIELWTLTLTHGHPVWVVSLHEHASVARRSSIDTSGRTTQHSWVVLRLWHHRLLLTTRHFLLNEGLKRFNIGKLGTLEKNEERGSEGWLPVVVAWP